MRTDIKEMFASKADEISGWRNIDRNELCRLYVEHEHEKIAEAYLAAIIYKYWSRVDKLYRKTSSSCNWEDCYDLLVNSILYVLKKRQWLNPKSSLYQDINAPDRAINTNLRCLRVNHIVSTNRDKKKTNINTVSIERLYEENKDYILPIYKDNYEETTSLYEIVKDCVKKHNLLKGIIIDVLANEDCSYEGELCLPKLYSKLYNIGIEYERDFKLRYDEFGESICYDFSKLRRMNHNWIKVRTNEAIEQLRRYFRNAS